MTLSGCATVLRGAETEWWVQTDPAGAEVHTSHGHHCAPTPCSITLPRNAAFTATVHMEGYEPKEVAVTTRMTKAGGAAMAGNLLLGGLAAAGGDEEASSALNDLVRTDSGAMFDLTPNPLVLQLRPQRRSRADSTGHVHGSASAPYRTRGSSAGAQAGRSGHANHNARSSSNAGKSKSSTSKTGAHAGHGASRGKQAASVAKIPQHKGAHGSSAAKGKVRKVPQHRGTHGGAKPKGKVPKVPQHRKRP